MAFDYHIDIKKDHVLLVPEGSLLSLSEATAMLEIVDKELPALKYCLIDMGKLKHLNSEGLNVLLHILTRSRNAGGDTGLFNLSTHIQSLFIITKLSNIFTITNDKKSALKALIKA